LRIAFVSSQKKADKILRSVQSTAEEHGVIIDHIPLDDSERGDLTADNADCLQPSKLSESYDLVIQKVGSLAPGIGKKIFQTLKTRNPKVVIVDSPEAARKVSDRHEHSILVDSYLKKKMGEDGDDMSDVGFAPFAYCGSRFENLEEAREWARNEGLRFPLICKPMDPAKEHDLCVVFGPHGLLDGNLPEKAVFQQYVPHENRRMFKVYILGDEFMITQRASLPRLSEHTDHPSSTAASRPRGNWYYGRISAKAVDGVEGIQLDSGLKKRLISVADNMRSALGLRMFNVDAVLEVGTNQLFIVDVNYFPG